MNALDDYDTLVHDLIRRTEAAVDVIAPIAVDTGITFQIEDIVRKVEDGLPPDYPEAAIGNDWTRRDVIAAMARDLFSGDMYDD
ncbi:hypothetical protein [Streptomyces sp. WZ-12]|uniref:hypothetical protein n=1 Tax=Streptomyces sp. WZ-12 TaxID=3030210 RepID=UPI0023816480|nr:hypothetical protein [Streptomyces sp. WZ-12]